jgi:hypothetical protein
MNIKEFDKEDYDRITEVLDEVSGLGYIDNYDGDEEANCVSQLLDIFNSVMNKNIKAMSIQILKELK